MFAIVTIETFKVNLIVTNHSNIDWITKEIEDKSDILEFEFSPKTDVNVFDIKINRHRVVNITELNESIHRLLVDKKMYVILHKM